jgi:hypothetical protein
MTRARDVADTQENNGGGVAPFVAGKNKIINGDFGVWQRGTSFSNPAFGAYAADRWFLSHDGTGVTRTISQQTFAAGAAPVAGYEGTYFLRYAVSVAGTGNTANNLIQKIEDVRKFAGQTVTVSFWAKVATAATYSAGAIAQDFGTGGSSTVFTTPSPATFSFTTSWARYSYTVAVPSIAGKTIGTNSHFDVIIQPLTNTTFTLDLWGVQVEAGSVATPFTTATGTIQGELAACQRYYWRRTGTQYLGTGSANSATQADFIIQFPVEMRTAPTMATNSGTAYFKGFMGNTDTTATTIGNFFTTGTLTVNGRITGSGLTTGYATVGFINNAAAYLEASSEL